MRLNGKFWKNWVVPKRLIRLNFCVKVRILHANLGHPSKEAMCCMLKQAKAPEAVQRATQGFECNVCRQRGRTASTVPSAIPAITSPWEVVNVDTFWRSSPHKKVKTNRFNIVLVFLSWMNVPISMLRMLIVWIRKRPQEHHG